MFLKHFLNEEATCEFNKIVEMHNKLKTSRVDLIYKTGNKKNDKTYDFQTFETIRSFARKNYNNFLSLDDALEQQIRLKNGIYHFKDSTKPKEPVKKEKKALTLQLAIILLNGRQNMKSCYLNKSP